MKVTVCEFQNDTAALQADWEQLVVHVRQTQSQLVLLPEMPFYPWLASSPQLDPALWEAAVEAHDRWQDRLVDLSPALVVGSRPTIRSARRINEGFIYTRENGYMPVHQKYYLPNEDGFWESTWYHRAEKKFNVVQAGSAAVGFLICTEQWFGEHARAYGKQGDHLVLCPRATPAASTAKWLAGGQTVAVVSGAFCLSSNRGGIDAGGMSWGGTGWVVEPQEGIVLALTDRDQPFKTVDIDLSVAERARKTYPRYVKE